MSTHKQQRNQNYPSSESGEEFSDVGPTLDSDDDESVVQTQDNWTFPVVSSKAKRDLGWTPQTSFEQLIRLMVDADLKLLSGRGGS